MLKPKIKITSIIRDRVQELRLKANKSGTELSTDLGKSEGWVSLFENGRISTIQSTDLIKIFSILLSVSEEEAIQYIENLLTVSVEDSSTTKEKFLFEDEYDSSIEDELFEKIINNINEGFKFAYGKQKKHTFINLDSFMDNMHFDLGFMMGIISMPFNKLEGIDIKIKKKLFSEIGNIVKKYVKEYGKVDDENSNEVD